MCTCNIYSIALFLLTLSCVVFYFSSLRLHRQLNLPAALLVYEEFECKPVRPVFASEIDLDDDGERPVILTVPVCHGIKVLACDYFRTSQLNLDFCKEIYPWLGLDKVWT